MLSLALTGNLKRLSCKLCEKDLKASFIKDAACLDFLRLRSCLRCLTMMTTAIISRSAPSTAIAIPIASTTSTLALLVAFRRGRSAFTYLAQVLPNLQQNACYVLQRGTSLLEAQIIATLRLSMWQWSATPQEQAYCTPVLKQVNQYRFFSLAY